MIFSFQDEIEKGIDVLKTQLSQKLREENLPVEQQKRFIAILVQVSRIERLWGSITDLPVVWYIKQYFKSNFLVKMRTVSL